MLNARANTQIVSVVIIVVVGSSKYEYLLIVIKFTNCWRYAR